MAATALYVAAGSALGGVCRYFVSAALNAPTGFPWGTLAVNVFGSLLLGLVSGLLAHHAGQWHPAAGIWQPESLRAFAVLGFCGGFTTFSTFSNEAFRMLESSHWLLFAAYVGTSLLAGIGAVMLGYALAR